MRQTSVLNHWFIFAVLAVAIFGANVTAEVLYIDAKNGTDANPGTKEKPLRTINQAAVIANGKTEPGPTTIKIAPGVYNLTKAVFFKNARPYTKEKRLTIEATVLPDNPNWKPALMPVVLSTENSRTSEMVPGVTETYSMKIKISHVTIRGLKFLGNPLPNNWHACVERIGKDLDDLLITQCVFVGDPDTLNIYCAVLATGDRFIVDHCIFNNCHASTVYWDGLEGIGGKGCAMRYCIVDGAYQSGVWTCQTAEDFEFHHNVITHSRYLWMRKSGDHQTYRLHDCIVAGNRYYSGYGNAGGPTGQTGAEVTYQEKNVLKTGELMLVKDKRARHYLHPLPGTLGSDLGAGLFKK